MKKAIHRLIIIAVSIVLSSKAVLSYLDPGIGGAILGSLWPVLAAIFTAIGVFLTKYFWKPIKGVFSKIPRKKAN